MSDTAVLGGRAVREAVRTPDALVPTIFIPLFFLVVNTGQVSKIFQADTTPFLQGQGYAAFQLPTSLLLAGYFDKLRAAPISRVSIVFGRLWAEAIKSVVLTSLMVLVALPFGVRIASGIAGFAVLLVLIALLAVVFSGFMQLIALKTRSAAATISSDGLPSPGSATVIAR